MDFISTGNLIIIPSLIAIGYCLKVADCIEDNYIPLLLLACGCVLGLFNGFSLHSALEGIICSAVAMGIYDTSKTLRKKGNKWTKN